MSTLGMVSERTKTYVAVVGSIILLTAVLQRLRAGDPYSIAAISDVGNILSQGVTAVAILAAALSFPRGERLRIQWGLIGLGCCSFTFGIMIWSYFEIVLRQPSPYPGLPDVGFLGAYLLLPAGTLYAALSVGRAVELRKRVLGVLALTLVLGVGLYFLLLRDLLANPTVSTFEKLVSTVYPVGDLLLLLAPSLLIVSVMLGGKLAWPWWFMALGAGVLGMADTSLSWLQLHGMPQTGGIVFSGFQVGWMLIGVGASLARDVHKSMAGPAVSDSRASAA